MNQTFKVGIIGLGVVGERILKQFLDHPRFEVIAYCEPNDDRLKHIQEKYGERDVYSSHSELLENDQIDLVYLAVPPKFHHPIALNIIAHGKHILCEKPLANSIEEAYEMYEAAENKGVVNAMNFPLPFQDEYIMMKKMLEEQVLGEIRRIEFHMYFPEWPRAWQQNSWIATREQGGFIREIGPHYLHLTSKLLGMPEVEQSFVEYPHDSKKSEEGFVAKLTVQEVPVLFNGLSQIGQKEHLSYKIYGSKAVMELRNWRDLILFTKDHDKEKIKNETVKGLSLLDELINALDGQENHLISFEEGYQIQKALEGILQG